MSEIATSRLRHDSLDTEPDTVGSSWSGRSDDLDAVMQRIAALLAESLRVDYCAMFIYDEGAERTINAYRYGHSIDRGRQEINSDQRGPRDVPIEAEITWRKRAIRRSTPADFERWPLVVPGYETVEGRTCDLVTPLLWADRVVGVGYLWRRDDPTPFDDDEMAIAEDVGRLAAMAVTLARRYQDEREQTGQLRALLDVSNASINASALDDVLPILTRAIRDATGSDSCNLFLFDDDGDQIVKGFPDGLTGPEIDLYNRDMIFPVSDWPVEVRMRDTLAAEVITDLENDLGQCAALTGYARETGIEEILVAPIVYRQRMIGVVYAWRRDGARAFSPHAVAAAQAIAQQAAGIIVRANLDEARESHSAQTRALQRISQAVLTRETLDEALDDIVGAITTVIPFEFAFVGLLNSERTTVRIARTWGLFSDRVIGLEFPASRGITGDAITRNVTTFASNAAKDERAYQLFVDPIQAHSVMVAPLASDDGVFGALYLGHSLVGRYQNRDVSLFGLIAQQAALAIERVRSRNALARSAREQMFLASVTATLLEADDPYEVLDQICRDSVGRLADGVVLGLSSWQFGSLRPVFVGHIDAEIEQRLSSVVQMMLIEPFRDQIEPLLRSSTPTLRDTEIDSEPGHPAGQITGEFGIRRILTAPLAAPGRARGLMFLLLTDSDREFDSQSIELAMLIATRIGDALERKHLTDNQAALLRVSAQINALQEASQVFETIASELGRIIPYDEIFLGEVDHERAVVRPRLSIGSPRGDDSDWVLPLEFGIVGEVVGSGVPVFDNRAHQRPTAYYRSAETMQFYRERGESVLVAPLVVDGNAIGVILLGRLGSGRFTGAEFEVFQVFASLTASAFSRISLAHSNREMYRASVEVLAAVVDAKDPTTLQHSRKVSRYARLCAERMGLPVEEVELIELAGLLHDIGKLSIPDRILSKPGKLTPDERKLILAHPDRGASILQQHPALTSLVPLVRHHHEWFDGSGYPARLVGRATPLGASIISVADAFDTMTSERTYQAKRSSADALAELRRCSGTQFHPWVVNALISIVCDSPDIADRVLSVDGDRLIGSIDGLDVAALD